MNEVQVNSQGNVQSVDFTSQEPIQPQRSSQTEMMVTRQAQEVQVAMLAAKKFPRDQVVAYNNIMRACQRRKLAESSMYEFPRGNEKITGPSIRLAEAIAQNWGNIDFGFMELEQRKGKENRPVYFNYVEFVKLMKFLDEEMVGTGEVYKTGAQAGKEKIVKGDYNGKLTNIVNLLVDKARDSKYQFLFEDMPQQYLYDFMKDVLNNDVPVKNIDLSEVPHDVAIPIIGVITKLVYEIQRTYKSKDVNPVTLVCDEAHVYIPNDFSLSASQRRMVEIFENIAKEGRKFGVTLFPASQRPSELNKTIMAQCANFIVGKMNNENDKAMIKGMMPEGSESVIDETSMFSPGDVFVIGDAVPIPLKIHVALAEERPQSRTIAFWDRWKNAGTIDITDATTKYITG